MGRSILWALPVVILAVAGPARAANGCKADVERFCKGIPAGGGRIAACLKSHEGELSQPCKDDIAAAKVKMKAFVDACKADAQKFCHGIPVGKGRILSCLKSHEADLAPACRAEMDRPAGSR